MMKKPDFPHLPLIHKMRGLARFTGGGDSNKQVENNKKNRGSHSKFIINKMQNIAMRSQGRAAEREQEALPAIAGGIPFVLQIPEDDDEVLSFIAENLRLEVVAEYDAGYLIVSPLDLDLTSVLKAATDFGVGTWGSGSMAKIIDIDEDPLSEPRLRRILVSSCISPHT
jgi:hypothetical protein